MGTMSLNIVIPVLNEESDLEKGIVTTLNYLNRMNFGKNTIITIADNGSTDHTEEIAHKLCTYYKNVTYFKVSQKGVGLAFREGVKRNTCDIVGYMDIDLATDIKHLSQVYSAFTERKASIVVGSRLKKGAQVHNRTLLREVTSRALNIMLKLILKVKFTDAMCGFKFYRSDVAQDLIKKGSNNPGWFFCAEMLIRAEWDGITITEIPVIWRDDHNSKVKVGKLSMSYLTEIIKLFKEHKRH